MDEMAFGLILMWLLGIPFGLMVKFFYDLIWTPRSYPFDVLLYEKRADGYERKIDKGKIIEKKGEFFKLKLKGTNKITKPIPFKYIQGGKRNFITVYSPTLGEYYAMEMKFANGGVELNTISDDNKFWLTLEQKEVEAFWKAPPSWFSQWGGVVMVAVCGIVMMGLIYFGGQHLVDMANAGVSQAQQSVQPSQSFIDSIVNGISQGQQATASTPVSSATTPTPPPIPVG